MEVTGVAHPTGNPNSKLSAVSLSATLVLFSSFISLAYLTTISMWEAMSAQMWEANVSGYVRGAAMQMPKEKTMFPIGFGAF